MSDLKKLKERLFCSKKNLHFKVSDEEFDKSFEFAERYKKFLDCSKTERESTAFFSKSLISTKNIM